MICGEGKGLKWSGSNKGIGIHIIFMFVLIPRGGKIILIELGM
jgi:hypothetical protein